MTMMVLNMDARIRTWEPKRRMRWQKTQIQPTMPRESFELTVVMKTQTRNEMYRQQLKLAAIEAMIKANIDSLVAIRTEIKANSERLETIQEAEDLELMTDGVNAILVG
ncbi:hypothetical protein Poli38472_003725 [Pythium oligandrum]|uniref:Uncharacterized protein n=1 Tax=Pythium oligandrum TaxID=41045 RepID=A0A8K1CNQ0_PYTOL|nr:hypothetical protein Poli38472_003725 [Pythium oligandrum]|eukprot:TMW65960.1 hypothetical protein Poli38472_003725 [Pythium oligandrum]